MGRQGGGEAWSTGEAGECRRREGASGREERRKGDRSLGAWSKAPSSGNGSELQLGGPNGIDTDPCRSRISPFLQ